MALPELYRATINNLKHYIIAASDEDAAIILFQKLKNSSDKSHELDIQTLGKRIEWVNTISPRSEVGFTHSKFGVGYYGDEGLDDKFYPVRVRQYYIDLALEYIEHEAPI